MLPALLATALATTPIPGPQVLYETRAVACAAPGEQMTLSISFEAGFQNRVQILDASAGRTLAIFDNRFGGYEASDATHPPGPITIEAGAVARCVVISATFRTSDGAPWVQSKGRFSCTDAGFEDSTDADYNDAFVHLDGGSFREVPGCTEPQS